MRFAHAAFQLAGIGMLSDLSDLSGTLENGRAANILGGMGSGLAWASGNTFLAYRNRPLHSHVSTAKRHAAVEQHAIDLWQHSGSAQRRAHAEHGR